MTNTPIEQLESRRLLSAAVASDVDSTFGSEGASVVDIGRESTGRVSVALPDGKVLIAGSVGSNAFLARFRTAGSLDTTFASHGIARFDLGHSEWFDQLAILPDGNLLLGGSNNVQRSFLVRYRPGGTLDTGNRFGDGNGYRLLAPGDAIAAMAISSDKIFVASGQELQRYNIGTAHLDTGFGGGDGRIDLVAATVMDSFMSNAIAVGSGKVAVGGFGASSDSSEKKLPQRLTPPMSQGEAIIALDTDGTLDNTFDSNGVAFYEASAPATLAFDSTGRLYAATTYLDFNPNSGNGLFRFAANGFDTFAGAPGSGKPTSIAFLSDGKILIAGPDSASRFKSDGTLDFTYSTDGTAHFNPPMSAGTLTLQGDGDAVILDDGSVVQTTNFAVPGNGAWRNGPLLLSKLKAAPDNLPISFEESASRFHIQGTENDDTVDISLDGEDDRFVIVIDAQQFHFIADNVTGADVMLGSGNDLFDAAQTQVFPVTVDGEAGNDTINGSQGPDSILGGLDADLIHGYGGSDSLFGNGGKDTIYGDEAADRIDGGKSNDVLDGGSSNDRLVGGEGRDLFLGQGGDDLMYSLDGEIDTVFGGSGIDRALVDDHADPTVAHDLVASVETFLSL